MARPLQSIARMNLDEQVIAELSLVSDPIGLISLYVGVPVDRARAKPSWPIEIRHSLSDLDAGLRRALPHDDWGRVHARIEAIEPDVARLLDPKARGRGRALFAPVSDDRVETVVVQRELPTKVSFDRGPVVCPLVAVLDEERPAGVLTIHKKGATLYEWRPDGLGELVTRAFELDRDAWRDVSGPPSPNPRLQEGSSPDLRFDRRQDVNRARMIDELVLDVDAVADTRRWDELVVFGDARLTRLVATSIEAARRGAGGLTLLVDDRVLDDSTAAAIHTHAAERVRAARLERELALVEHVEEVARSGGRACVGVASTLDALNRGRVDRLYLDPTVELSGASTPDGQLFSDDGPRPPPGTVPSPAPNLGELVVRRALSTNARTLAVDGAARDVLTRHGGLAASLRW
ncbi:VLRF1 family aeRF1-type release factor [Myxococcota bacterium]|nr:VLRF1 family aeRF1-type release factor [Myxococcota bacterium]